MVDALVDFKDTFEKKNVLISREEELVVEELKIRNLKYVNSIAKKVCPKNTLYTKVFKRVFDIIISLPMCLLLIPINVVIALITMIDVGWPIIYRQTRIGKDEKRFSLIKFRSMNEEKDVDGRLLPPLKRVTKWGSIMRKLSLDELLQFWCVLKGDMSLIGPRPVPPFIYERMCDRHKQRSVVRPGLECPRVIDLEIEDMCKYQRTYENDIWYVENISFSVDIKMCFLLIKMVFDFDRRDRQAKCRETSFFVGYDKNGYAISMIKYLERKKRGIKEI